MGKNRHKDKQRDVQQSSLLNEVDQRIGAMVRRLAGDKLGSVVFHAEDLILLQGKQPNRALADALETFKLIPASE